MTTVLYALSVGVFVLSLICFISSIGFSISSDEAKQYVVDTYDLDARALIMSGVMYLNTSLLLFIAARLA